MYFLKNCYYHREGFPVAMKTTKQNSFSSNMSHKRKKKLNHCKLFVRYFNILPDLMSFICMRRFWLWSLLAQFWISSCFSPPFKSHSALKSTLHTALHTRLLKYFSVQSSVFLCCCPRCCFWDCPAAPPPPHVCWRSPLFLSISWSVLLYLGGRGWYLHSLPPSSPPPQPLPPPLSAWYDLNWCPAGAFFPRTPQTGWSGGGVAVCRAFSSSPIKIKSPVVWRGPLGSWL